MGYFTQGLDIEVGALSNLRGLGRTRSPVMIDRSRLQSFVKEQVERQPARFVPQEVKGGAVLFVPFTSPAAVAAGAGVTLTVSPIEECVLRRLIISPTIAAFFSITLLSTGRTNLINGAGALPADVFTPNTTDPPVLDGDVIKASGQININATNIGGAPSMFYGTFLCVRC